MNDSIDSLFKLFAAISIIAFSNMVNADCII